MTNSKGIKLLAAVAVLAVMFAGAAVIFSDNGDVDAAASNTTYLSGTLTGEQVFDKTDNVVVINNDLKIPAETSLTISNATFTVNEGVTVTIEAGGKLVMNGNAKVQINGTIVADGKDGETVAIVNNVAAPAEDSGVFVSGSIVLNKGAVMAYEGIGNSSEGSETSTQSGNESAQGYITILSGGSIEVTKKNSNVSMIKDQTITMAEGVTFTMYGYAKNVTLTAYTGSDKYYQTSKITIDTVEPTANNGKSKNVSSIIVKTVVEKNQAFYNSETNKVTMKNYLMDVSGTLKGGDKIATSVGAIKYNDQNSNSYYGVGSDGKVDQTKKIMPTVSVSGDLAVDATGKVAVDENTLMTVAGSVAVAYDDKSENKSSDNRFTINGDLYITGNVNLNWNAVTAKGTGKVTVDGGLMTVTDYVDCNRDSASGSTDNNKIAGLYAAYYTVENVASGSVTYFCDLKDAIAGAAAAGSDEVVVYAGKESQNQDTPAKALEAGAYIVEDGTVIPDGITLVTMNALYVPKDATLTFEVGSSHDTSTWGSKYIFVLGKVVDNDDILNADKIYYEVSKYNEDTNVRVYTTLTIALSEAVSGEIITLANSAEIDSTVTIASGVTVIVDNGTGQKKIELAIKDKGELIINGILDVQGTVTISTNGKIVNNNIIVISNSATIQKATEADAATQNGGSKSDNKYYIAGFYAEGTIGDYEDVNFILAPAVAAANSATLGNMTVKAKTSYSGDLVFNAAEDATDVTTITIEAEAVFGKITIDGYSVTVGTDGKFTATVGADVTAGHSAVKLDKVTSALEIVIDSQDSGEAVTTTLTINNNNGTAITLKGDLSIVEGQVYLAANIAVGAYTDKTTAEDASRSVMTIASGAELLLDGKTLTVSAKALNSDKDYYGLIIDGTLTTGKGTVLISAADETNTSAAKVLLNGTFAVNSKQEVNGILVVVGTLVIDDGKKVTVNGSMVVGTASETLGAAATVTGALNVPGKLSVYPGADISGALIDVDSETGESSASKLELLINGQLYMTGYSTTKTTLVSVFIPESVSFAGYKPISKDNWSLSETSTVAVGNNTIGDHSKAYAKAVLKTANVQVSVGKGMSVYIDNVRYSNGQTAKDLTVGEHTVAVTVDPGYTGTTSILFNGVAVNSGVFTITADMGDSTDPVVLSVTGDITVNPGVTTEDNGGTGLTDILLVVLVVLIAVMAIMVALRMMRS